MEISFSKLESLAEAMGEGAKVFVSESGVVTLQTNRVFLNDEVDAPLPVATIYNKKCVTYDEALQLVKDLKPFVLYSGAMKGEYDEENGLYVIHTRKGTKDEPEFHQFAVYEKKHNRWHLLSEEDFKKVKGNSTNKRHFEWVRDTVIPAVTPEVMLYGYTEAEFDPYGSADYSL